MSMPVETITDDATLSEQGFYWREANSIRVLICKPLEDAGFVNLFSTRLGGVSDFPKDSLNLAGFDEDSSENIYENRRRFLTAFDGEFKLATVWQMHGVDVKVVESDEDIANTEERFDALVSDRLSTLVGVKTADCVPILIGDPRSGSFAAVHSGWKGTTAAIVTKTVEKLQNEYGADPANMIVAIGPSASVENYEVGTNVIEAFGARFSDSRKYFRPTRPGHALVDLKLANTDLLVGAGVRSGNIFIAPFCTIGRVDLFFSYRVEKQAYGKTGRLLSVIGKGG